MVEEIKQWVEEFVSVHNTELNKIPCPFAKQAVLQNTVEYLETTKLRNTLMSLLHSWNDNHEVVVLYADTELYEPDEVADIVKRFNKLAMPYNLVALEDHPDDPEVLNGVTMNFGKAILVLVQPLTKLNKASNILKRQGYYDDWPEENYNDVVAWRHKS